jgi:hypothetical protein
VTLPFKVASSSHVKFQGSHGCCPTTIGLIGPIASLPTGNSGGCPHQVGAPMFRVA